MPNKVDADNLAMMAELEQHVGDDDQINARLALSQLAPLDEQRTAAEQLRGQQVLLRNLKDQYDVQSIARNELSRKFNPDHVEHKLPDEGGVISSAERARRDEYRKNHVVNWSKLDRD